MMCKEAGFFNKGYRFSSLKKIWIFLLQFLRKVKSLKERNTEDIDGSFETHFKWNINVELLETSTYEISWKER
jgi:hypothetical protein